MKCQSCKPEIMLYLIIVIIVIPWKTLTAIDCHRTSSSIIRIKINSNLRESIKLLLSNRVSINIDSYTVFYSSKGDKTWGDEKFIPSWPIFINLVNYISEECYIKATFLLRQKEKKCINLESLIQESNIIFKIACFYFINIILTKILLYHISLKNHKIFTIQVKNLK